MKSSWNRIRIAAIMQNYAIFIYRWYYKLTEYEYKSNLCNINIYTKIYV